MTALYVYDDARARRFEPFALTRPAGSLVAGAWPIASRWHIALQTEVRGFITSAHLDGFGDVLHPSQRQTLGVAGGCIPAGSIVADARFAPAVDIFGQIASLGGGPFAGAPRTGTRGWSAGGRVVAIRTTQELDVRELRDSAPDLGQLTDGGADETLRGWYLDGVWDLVRLLPEILADDLGLMVAMRTALEADEGTAWVPPPAHVTVLGNEPILIGDGYRAAEAPGIPPATIEPHVVLDATAGPIIIEHGAHVHAYTRLTGPCFIGPLTTVMGGDISACSIGPVCKVRGEMSNTIMLGFANKGHDGFVGHSVLGRWSNLGAGTITSNLKNTYGTVSLWTPEGVRDTGMQFLGTMFGDHAKTGIGTRLTTGTVLGAGANVYGSAMPPKVVAPFAWGEKPPYAEYRLDKFLEVAERVMARRKVKLTDDGRRQLTAAYAARWTVDGGSGR